MRTVAIKGGGRKASALELPDNHPDFLRVLHALADLNARAADHISDPIAAASFRIAAASSYDGLSRLEREAANA